MKNPSASSTHPPNPRNSLGLPHLHFRRTSSTNDDARKLAISGAPHGTLVSADQQTAGRGRHGRKWFSPPGGSVSISLILRSYDELISLRAGLAVADIVGTGAMIKWPNDVLVDDRKVAGILVEGRPQENWAVLGIGLNRAVELSDLPTDLRTSAGTLGESTSEVATPRHLLRALNERLAQPPAAILSEFRLRDVLRNQPVRWSDGEGTAVGIDEQGRLMVENSRGNQVALDAGEVHLL